jgi:hypothetical protein
MVRMGRFAVALCFFEMVASAQEDPLAWLPLQVGSRRVYEYESKSGDRNRPDVDRWTTEETITGWITIPEGLVVLREAKQQSNAIGQTTVPVIAPNGQLRKVQEPGYSRGVVTARDNEPYLVHGNCVYVIYGGGWDSERQELRPGYRKYLSEGAVSPDFCFPLQMSQQWGNNDTPWRVEPSRGGGSSFLPAEYVEAIHIFCRHFGSGGAEDVWFQKGVGIVGEQYSHNGTYEEHSKKLLSFMP